MPPGYYRFPTIHADNIVFVCEDDLWSVPASGGIARRLTSNLGEVSRPQLSRDGTELAFVGREEGQAEVYSMPALGGPARRLSHLGSRVCQTAGWTPDGKIVFASDAHQPIAGITFLYTLTKDGLSLEALNLGPAQSVAYGPQGGMVIGRNTGDPARWKRYRGGTAGQLWIDEAGQGAFHPLIRLKANLASPMWLSDRIYFISDHEGVGNLYSCLPSGEDLRRHTDHDRYYARHASSDGQRIVYHAGADLFLYDPASDHDQLIPVEFHSPQTQRNRKFVESARYLSDWALHPNGQAIAISTRGKIFAFANWEGAVLQYGEEVSSAENGSPGTGIRYRLPTWLHDGKRVAAVTDAGGEESILVWNADGSGQPARYPGLDIGRPDSIEASPTRNQIVFSNHRYELLFLDLDSGELRRIDTGKASPMNGFDWSPDGEWVAYSVSMSLQCVALKLWKVSTGESFPLTQPVLRDVAPAFDPQGKYLYFISYRTFDPVFDNLHFDLNFPRGMKPYLITLQKDLPSPFIPQPRMGEGKKKEAEKESPTEQEADQPGPAPAEGLPAENQPVAEPEDEGKKEPHTQIDLDGIEGRIVAFPVPEGLYGRVLGTKDGKVLYSRFPIEGALNQSFFQTEPEAKGTLLIYNYEEQKEDTLLSGLSDFDLNLDGGSLIYRTGNRLRVLKAGEKPNGYGDDPGRKSGWIDLDRVKVSVLPGAEWRQMFREAWRLQRDQFWTPDMSQIDWLLVHDRYLPLVDRVSSRSEFSDLMWEMQGELGTSHAYEIGGDYRREPGYSQGKLGAEFKHDPETGGWQITQIIVGDTWNPQNTSPLSGPGVNLKVGDQLTAINGRKLSQTFSPAEALVNQAGEEVILTVLEAGETEPRQVVVKTLYSESGARYRAWVEANRQRVHQATQERIGYVHIPDMGARGYAEFHRGYLAEIDRDGLIVDVRFNGGGNVSSLILEKLARRRIGYDTARWSQVPHPYPPESVLGSMVALTNEYAGSDGDIFSHGFKVMGLGPLIGTRTWGGVIGIEPRHALVDGTLTTQPEFSFWFSDVGWGVENYGVDPDIEVDNLPQDYARGEDVQLERAISEVMKLLESSQARLPEFPERPSKAPPSLPKR